MPFLSLDNKKDRQNAAFSLRRLSLVECLHLKSQYPLWFWFPEENSCSTYKIESVSRLKVGGWGCSTYKIHGFFFDSVLGKGWGLQLLQNDGSVLDCFKVKGWGGGGGGLIQLDRWLCFNFLWSCSPDKKKSSLPLYLFGMESITM